MTNTDEIILKQLINQLMSAYRKYKSFIYYDSYSIIQRMELSNFERNPTIIEDEYEINEFFEELANIIIDEEKFNEFTDFICDEINVISLPKHAKEENKTKKVIRNFPLENFNMDKLHYFIDLPIVGHIIGVLWILRCGYLLDDKLYKNCYGNRLNKHLTDKLKNKKSDYYIDNDCWDFTNFLFVPYINNYQAWRDNGLNSVNKILADRKNAIMVSLDLKEYFHRSLIDFKTLNKDIADTRKYIDEKYNFSINDEDYEINVHIDNLLTKFVEKVFYAYSNKFDRKYLTKTLNNKKINTENYPMLPVGFLPSLIISNWNLQGFDQAIVENVRPEYYGRYVDDIIIVLGSHEKSESYGLQQIEEESFDELIERYLTDLKHPKTHIFKKESRENEIVYRIYNQSFNNSKNNKITYHYEGLEIQDSKLKTYFFSHKHSNAIIDNFKTNIKRNNREFELMQDFESVKQEFKENLYTINYNESINKIRDIGSVNVRKFEISKILSRVNWNTTDVSDNITNELVNDMIGAFKGEIFDYITLWDRIFTMLLINNKYDQLKNLINYILKNISEIRYEAMEGNSYKMGIENKSEEYVVKTSLIRCLYSILSRVFSLKYNSDVKNIIDNIKYDFQIEERIDFTNQISNFLYASMQNTSLMKYPLENLSGIYNNFDESTHFNLISPKNKYCGAYGGFSYPRYVKLHEVILNTINNNLFVIKDKKSEKEFLKKFFDDDDELLEQLLSSDDSYLQIASKYYQYINFANEKSMYEDIIKKGCELNCSQDTHCPLVYGETQFKNLNIINVKGERKEKIKVGLLNANVDYTDFEKRLLGKAELSSERFDKIKLLINEAINKNVELLLMPEMYIPYEWLEKIINVSRKHQMAMIFGIEPLEQYGEFGNYIMMTLPFKFDDKYDECALMFRSLNHLSPAELNLFEKYELTLKGEDEDISNYYMCIWNGIHIVPYSSYEIASVEDRGIFKSCCDILTVSEYNKDNEYTNDILKSLSRDLFCYCIKSNIAKYGGSSIIQPTNSSDKYLVNLKGGYDDYIVTHELDIRKLRKNAIKSDKILESYNFNPKPPEFRKNNVKERY